MVQLSSFQHLNVSSKDPEKMSSNPKAKFKRRPIHRCATIAPSLLRPRKKPCQFGQSLRVHSIPFCPLRWSTRVPFEQCALHGVWCALCACTRTETSSRFVHVCTSLLMSCRIGPTEKYDGEAHIQWSSAGALQRGAAPRLSPLASSFAVQKKISFALSCASIPPFPRGIVTWAFWNHSEHLKKPLPTRNVNIKINSPSAMSDSKSQSVQSAPKGDFYGGHTPCQSWQSLLYSFLVSCAPLAMVVLDAHHSQVSVDGYKRDEQQHFFARERQDQFF